jgi:type VI secretion system protein ImpI/type VI secretion system protein
MPSLTLTVLRWPEYGAAETRHVHGTSLTVGRGAESGWTLPDPLKSLSRKHCQIDCIGGVWQVRDLSSNGTFFNAATSAIGRDRAQPLVDGDRLRLGDYEIEVRIHDDARPGAGAAPASGLDAAPGPFGAPARPGFAAARLPGLDDPVDVPLTGRGGPALRSFGAMPDHGAASAQAFVPPAAEPALRPPPRPSHRPIVPDDWYSTPAPAGSLAPAAAVPGAGAERIPTSFDPAADLGQPGPAPALPKAAPAAPAAPAMDAVDPSPFTSGPVRTERAAASAATAPGEAMAAAAAAALSVQAVPAALPSGAIDAGTGASALAALLAGGQLPPEAALRAGADPDAALRTAGALLREAVGGLRALLIARGTVKREFRIEQTMLQPKENNPLKFAASDEQALSALLDPRTAALSAVREAVDDLTAHQVAVLAATQAAARALLERLDPAGLEAEAGGGGLFDAREKRLWEAYKRRHAKLAEQFDDDFESAFGKAFARAYEGAVGKGRT